MVETTLSVPPSTSSATLPFIHAIVNFRSHTMSSVAPCSPAPAPFAGLAGAVPFFACMRVSLNA